MVQDNWLVQLYLAIQQSDLNPDNLVIDGRFLRLAFHQEQHQLKLQVTRLDEDAFITKFCLINCLPSLDIVDRISFFTSSFFSLDQDAEDSELSFDYYSNNPPAPSDFKTLVDFFFQLAQLVTKSNDELVHTIQTIIPEAIKH
ncbi:hypothetical protein A2368_01135 [Candidatus Collierbacteria bacterium RIFOXYB1_FULL_49_13]|uniref:Uncharacterized protein n=1 Tax=Candidatus Collierbacteria bacterium RIFOXYB1_FULL_49_13 TaxID=1817728 RepID=A0A1F5FG76_9BACT|nr:MAG: hypothetical protein A2368_01135 [Candidatus Collierbacteria bacterium RIFOXYB1_FULL_49_13]